MKLSQSRTLLPQWYYDAPRSHVGDLWNVETLKRVQNINQEKGEAEDLRQKNLEEAQKRRDNAKELSLQIANLDTNIAEHNASIEKWTNIRDSFENSIAKFDSVYQKNLGNLLHLRSRLTALRRDSDNNGSEISRISAKMRDLSQRNATILKDRAKAEEWLVRVNTSLKNEKQKKAQAEQEKAQAEEDRGHELKLQEYYVKNAKAWGLEINRLVSQQRGVINQQQKINNTATAEGNAQVESLAQENNFQNQADEIVRKVRENPEGEDAKRLRDHVLRFGYKLGKNLDEMTQDEINQAHRYAFSEVIKENQQENYATQQQIANQWTLLSSYSGQLEQQRGSEQSPQALWTQETSENISSSDQSQASQKTISGMSQTQKGWSNIQISPVHETPFWQASQANSVASSTVTPAHAPTLVWWEGWSEMKTNTSSTRWVIDHSKRSEDVDMPSDDVGDRGILQVDVEWAGLQPPSEISTPEEVENPIETVNPRGAEIPQNGTMSDEDLQQIQENVLPDTPELGDALEGVNQSSEKSDHEANTEFDQNEAKEVNNSQKSNIVPNAKTVNPWKGSEEKSSERKEQIEQAKNVNRAVYITNNVLEIINNEAFFLAMWEENIPIIENFSNTPNAENLRKILDAIATQLFTTLLLKEIRHSIAQAPDENARDQYIMGLFDLESEDARLVGMSEEHKKQFLNIIHTPDNPENNKALHGLIRPYAKGMLEAISWLSGFLSEDEQWTLSWLDAIYDEESDYLPVLSDIPILKAIGGKDGLDRLIQAQNTLNELKDERIDQVVLLSDEQIDSFRSYEERNRRFLEQNPHLDILNPKNLEFIAQSVGWKWGRVSMNVNGREVFSWSPTSPSGYQDIVKALNEWKAISILKYGNDRTREQMEMFLYKKDPEWSAEYFLTVNGKEFSVPENILREGRMQAYIEMLKTMSLHPLFAKILQTDGKNGLDHFVQKFHSDYPTETIIDNKTHFYESILNHLATVSGIQELKVSWSDDVMRVMTHFQDLAHFDGLRRQLSSQGIIDRLGNITRDSMNFAERRYKERESQKRDRADVAQSIDHKFDLATRGMSA